MNGFDLSNINNCYIGGVEASSVYIGSTLLWPSIQHDYSQDYFTLEALESTEFRWSPNSAEPFDMYYSTDNGSTWNILRTGSIPGGSTGTISAGNKVLFKSSNNNSNHGGFTSTGNFNVSGNIMSLVYGDNFAGQTSLPSGVTFMILFQDCTTLINANKLVLPATTAIFWCYGSMFKGCTSLLSAPKLPATTLSIQCYTNMFEGCASLRWAPVLPAPTLVGACYQNMFNGCTSLNNVVCLATDISATNCTKDWLDGVSATGIFTKNSANNSWTTGASGIPTGWTVQSVTPPHDYSLDYLTFEALESGTFTWTDTQNSNSIYYSTDNGSTWSTLASGSSTPTIAANNKVLFKASGLTIGSSSGIGTFSSTGAFNAMGNIMSLVYGDNFANQTTINNNNQFYKLFKTSKIVDASNLILPATTLSENCYREMFDGSGLEITPKSLPATTLATNCYRSMFGNCKSLITVMSILPATTLATECYRYMFAASTVTIAPELPATTLADNCYRQMFYKCANLTVAPELPATTLAQNCYYQMFYSCTSLVSAPELPATTLEQYCYYGMFYGCTSLVSAPELPATTLEQYCYYQMFYSCTSLSNIVCLATDISASHCIADWVNNVAASGTFTKAASMNSWRNGRAGIPSGWTVQNAS